MTKELARELKRISERVSRGHWVPHEVVRKEMLADMAIELHRLAAAYQRTGRGAKGLLDKLTIAEVAGVDPKVLTKIRRDLGERATKRQAA
ncbi:MAG TPA: hypothetical protein VHJ20_14540 [Polyangia bacterium]|nr:hypothetical protein [Polyangia bacterium]